MANVITRQHADKIARKLKAREEPGTKKSGGAREHIAYVVSHNDVEIAWFGVRRGSNKEQSHGHIPKDLHLSPNQCRRLADCSIDRDGYIEILRQRGLLPEEPAAAQASEADERSRRHRARRGGESV